MYYDSIIGWLCLCEQSLDAIPLDVIDSNAAARRELLDEAEDDEQDDDDDIDDVDDVDDDVAKGKAISTCEILQHNTRSVIKISSATAEIAYVVPHKLYITKNSWARFLLLTI